MKPPSDPRSGPAAVEVPVLVLRWQVENDHAAREALVRQFMPLARNLAKRYARSSTPLDDLIQVALLGLLRAIDRFDVERGHSLQAFAIPTILGEIRRYFRDSGWGVHVPRGAQERALAVRQAREALTNEFGRSPTVHELAEYMELDAEQILDGLHALHAYESVPLDAPRGGDEEGTLIDTLGAEDRGYELAEDMTALGSVLGHLDDRDREILRLRFTEELTQDEIAKRLGISQMQVSRLLRRSLESLRTSLEDGPRDGAE